MPELIAARSAVTIAIPAWRAARGLEDAEFAERYTASAEAIIRTILGAGWDGSARQLGATRRPAHGARAGAGHARRASRGGPRTGTRAADLRAPDPDERRAWRLDDRRGRAPVPRRVQQRAVRRDTATRASSKPTARQARRLNTNLRYLHESSIELAERLVATCPDGLDTVLFVNSGSEANDLAWRMATTFTGNAGGLCTTRAYHGISQASAALSPESWSKGRGPARIETWAPPDTYRGTNGDPAVFAAALERLAARGFAPAATILDGVLTSDGFYDLDPAYVAELVRPDPRRRRPVDRGRGPGRSRPDRRGDVVVPAVRDHARLRDPREADGQRPSGRRGHHATRDRGQRFADETVFFSTFGGNPCPRRRPSRSSTSSRTSGSCRVSGPPGEALRAGIREVAARTRPSATSEGWASRSASRW